MRLALSGSVFDSSSFCEASMQAAAGPTSTRKMDEDSVQETASPESVLATAAALSSTTEELFRIWQENCLRVVSSSPSNNTSGPISSSSNNNNNKQVSKRVANIRQEARDFFTALAQGTNVRIDAETTLQTKASSTDALALLVRSLSPCFAATTTSTTTTTNIGMGSRWAALACLVGAIEGCSDGAALEHNLPLVELLATFFLQHVGPISVDSIDNDDEEGFDQEDQIRDIGVTGLTVLIQCSSSSANNTSNTSTVEWTKFRLTTAKSGVERRCAEADNDSAMDGDSDDDEYGYSNQRRRPTAGGLSLMPRSRRSLCFDLIRSAVDAMTASEQHGATTITTDDATAEAEWASFCKFVAACLHGESDPRCLLQLLHLFGATLEAFRHKLAHSFPVSEFFDAVAPYYPIQFNPPPNDAYGITRAALREAVMAVLSCTAYDDAGQQQQHHHDDTMASLSCGLILESLVPPPEDGPATVKEQTEALEDLQTFLFATDNASSSINCDKMGKEDLKQISDALLVVHEIASMAVSRGEDVIQSKALADLSRTVVAQVAESTERRPNKQAWEYFVEQPVQKLALRLDSPSSGGVAIAYIACLASSGGAKTLRVCLKAGLAPLLSTLGDSSASDEDTATAAYGIGAFFSSCRTAMERAEKDGVHMHPHPLQPYTADAVSKAFTILSPLEIEEGADVSSPTVSVAVTRALESILLASPADLFAEEHVEKIVRLLRTMSSQLSGATCADSTSGDVMELLSASSQTLGAFLGRALQSLGSSPFDDASTLIETEKIRTCLREDVFGTMLSSARMVSKSASFTRVDWNTLAQAASYSLDAASSVVKPHVEAINKAINDKDAKSIKAIAEILSFLFEQSNQLAARAYQELSSPGVTALDVIRLLAPESVNRNEGEEASFGMSNLYLPKTNEDRDKLDYILKEAYTTVQLLRKGYEFGVTNDHFEELVATVDKVLPPLADEDTVRLSILLPFLSAAMESSMPGEGENVREALRAMAPELAEFATDSENFPEARSHAARCLHASISRFTPRNAQECMARILVDGKVVPSFTSVIHHVAREQQTASKEIAVASFLDSLSILALLGSAAACRGGPSSRTSNDIVLFLVELSCTGKTRLLMKDDAEIDLSVFNTAEVQLSTMIAIRSAAAFGSILSTESGNMLWKQRLTHISVKLLTACASIADSTTTENTYSLGLLASVCHVVCSSNLETISEENLGVLIKVIASGLKPTSLQASMREDSLVIKLLLASLVKLLCVSPTSFGNITYVLVTGTMRAYTCSEIACKLLALQALAAIAQTRNAPKVLRAVKPAVVSVLGAAMNHPSGLLRHAAVEVRNSWYIVE